MSFLPKDYQRPETPSRYMKFEEGDNQFRIVSDAAIGWEYWTDEEGKRQPHRVKDWDNLPENVQKAMDRLQQAKHFWAFVVLDCKDSEVKILEITQKTLMKDIEGLYLSKSWGDPQKYDIVVSQVKTGSDARNVKYSVRPEPKEELDEGVASFIKSLEVDLEKLFTGEDPFGTTQS